VAAESSLMAVEPNNKGAQFMFRNVFRTLLPESLRRQLNATGDRLALSLQDLRWKRMSPAERAAYVEQRLSLSQSSWLFLIGMNNTGTKLLVKILESHPELRSLPREGQFLTGELPNPLTLHVPRVFSMCLDTFRWTEDTQGGDPQRILYDWAYYYPPRPGVLVEKTPANVLRSRWLQRHFAPATFLATVRDPYATCEGIRRRDGVPIEYAATHWALCNEILLEDLPLLQSKLVMRYEDLCADPVRELERVRVALGLRQPFDGQVLRGEFGIENLAGSSAPIQNFNASSHARLSSREFDVISRIAGPTMERLGYSCRRLAAA
jgi:hypothetical protein